MKNKTWKKQQDIIPLESVRIFTVEQNEIAIEFVETHPKKDELSNIILLYKGLKLWN